MEKSKDIIISGLIDMEGQTYLNCCDSVVAIRDLGKDWNTCPICKAKIYELSQTDSLEEDLQNIEDIKYYL